MRPIKFKVWDKHKNYFNSDYAINGDLVWWACEQSIIQEKEHLVFLQFTWLLDKNWKEIYENDLVIWNTSFENYNDEFNWTREKPLCIIWDEKEAWFIPFTLWARWRCDVCNIEVIWNIYENPELLN